MTALARPAESAAPPRREEDDAAPRHLFGGMSDFLALGGISLVVLPALYVLPEIHEARVLAIALMISFFINYPHFAVSYSIFYRDFGTKIGPGRSPDPTLHWRYRFAGIVVPVALVGAMGGAIVAGRGELLGYGYNALVLTLGWHYVKQGYGMAMVDAALKRRFFTDVEKRLLRINGYSAWATAWMLSNRRARRGNYFEVPVRHFDIPDVMFALAVAVLAATSLAIAVLIGRRLLRGTPTAWTGVSAYLISVYAWTVFMGVDRVAVLLIPTLHSLQYLWVVARFQKNRAAAEPETRPWLRAYAWTFIGGAAMFWWVPESLDAWVPYDQTAVAGSAFLFLFWIGINVHHYFLDNVMWRRGNPEVTHYLFAHHGSVDSRRQAVATANR